MRDHDHAIKSKANRITSNLDCVSMAMHLQINQRIFTTLREGFNGNGMLVATSTSLQVKIVAGIPFRKRERRSGYRCQSRD